MAIGRVRGRASFLRLRAEGRRGRSGPVTVTAIPDPMIDPPAVAFAISRRGANAVVRNRAKRRLRAILHATPPPSGVYLVRADAAVADAPFDALTTDVVQALRTALSRERS